MWAPSCQCPIGNAGIHLIYQIWKTWRKPSIMNSCHSQTLSLGKAMGMEAFGLSNVYCGLSPLGANVVMDDG